MREVIFTEKDDAGRRTPLKNTPFHVVLIIATVLYTLIMIKLLFLRGRYPGGGYMYNLIPLKTIHQYIVNRNHFNTSTLYQNLLGNIILFIPMGISIPLLNRTFLNGYRFFLGTVTLLILVELIQLVTHRGSLDIDDVLINTWGAGIGFLLTKLLVFHQPYLKKQ